MNFSSREPPSGPGCRSDQLVAWLGRVHARRDETHTLLPWTCWHRRRTNQTSKILCCQDTGIRSLATAYIDLVRNLMANLGRPCLRYCLRRKSMTSSTGEGNCGKQRVWQRCPVHPAGRDPFRCDVSRTNIIRINGMKPVSLNNLFMDRGPCCYCCGGLCYRMGARQSMTVFRPYTWWFINEKISESIPVIRFCVSRCRTSIPEEVYSRGHFNWRFTGEYLLFDCNIGRECFRNSRKNTKWRGSTGYHNDYRISLKTNCWH